MTMSKIEGERNFPLSVLHQGRVRCQPLCSRLGTIGYAAGYAIYFLSRSLLNTTCSLGSYLWNRADCRKAPTEDELLKLHHQKSMKVQQDFKVLGDRSGKVVAESGSTTHLFRARKGRHNKISMKNFDQILSIDSKRRVAHVESMVSFQDLMSECVKRGLMPKVVPELLSIKVGGAISGLAVESSSFRNGLFHESVVSMRVLTGNGVIVTCSRRENRDLFFGLPNSYGTLGYILSAEIELEEAKPYVAIEHKKFTNPKAYFEAMEKICLSREYAFVDGTIFYDNNMVITCGNFVDSLPSGREATSYREENIYYKTLERVDNDFVTTEEYFSRWDIDSFWGTRDSFLQNATFRRVFGKVALGHKNLDRIKQLTAEFVDNVVEPVVGPSQKVDKERLVQDLGVPMKGAVEFYEWFRENIGMYPLFICPISSPNKKDHYPLWGFNEGGRLAVDIGFFGSKILKQKREKGYWLNHIIQKLFEVHGKQSLYSLCYMDRETFEKEYYGNGAYLALKRKYDPDGRFLTLYDKVVLGQGG